MALKTFMGLFYEQQSAGDHDQVSNSNKIMLK